MLIINSRPKNKTGEKLKKDKTSALMDIKNKIVENAIVEHVITIATVTPIKKTFAEAMDE